MKKNEILLRNTKSSYIRCFDVGNQVLIGIKFRYEVEYQEIKKTILNFLLKYKNWVEPVDDNNFIYDISNLKINPDYILNNKQVF